MVLTEREEARRRMAYDQARTDREAAGALGLPENTFQGRRSRRGLPPKGVLHNPLGAAEQERRLKAWAEAMDTAAAARVLGLDAETLRHWSCRMGLGSPRIFQAPYSRKEERYLAAYHEAGSDEEAASLLRVPASAFARWRRRCQLPATSLAMRAREFGYGKSAGRPVGCIYLCLRSLIRPITAFRVIGATGPAGASMHRFDGFARQQESVSVRYGRD